MTSFLKDKPWNFPSSNKMVWTHSQWVPTHPSQNRWKMWERSWPPACWPSCSKGWWPSSSWSTCCGAPWRWMAVPWPPRPFTAPPGIWRWSLGSHAARAWPWACCCTPWAWTCRRPSGCCPSCAISCQADGVKNRCWRCPVGMESNQVY